MKTSSSISIKLLILLALVNISVSQDFDFFYFVQQTGKTASNFNIHGLWPNFSNGSFPSDCNAVQNSSNTSKITDLIPRAQTSWPSLACPSKNKTASNNTNSDNVNFWKHEWDKHGTCSESVLDQHAYFEFSLNLKDRVDLLQILQNNGIKPDGNLYSVCSITHAIKQALGFVPGISCNTDPSGNSQLSEIFLCVDKSASNIFVECPILPKANCPDYVEFPIF